MHVYDTSSYQTSATLTTFPHPTHRILKELFFWDEKNQFIINMTREKASKMRVIIQTEK